MANINTQLVALVGTLSPKEKRRVKRLLNGKIRSMIFEGFANGKGNPDVKKMYFRASKNASDGSYHVHCHKLRMTILSVLVAESTQDTFANALKMTWVLAKRGLYAQAVSEAQTRGQEAVEFEKWELAYEYGTLLENCLQLTTDSSLKSQIKELELVTQRADFLEKAGRENLLKSWLLKARDGKNLDDVQKFIRGFNPITKLEKIYWHRLSRRLAKNEGDIESLRVHTIRIVELCVSLPYLNNETKTLLPRYKIRLALIYLEDNNMDGFLKILNDYKPEFDAEEVSLWRLKVFKSMILDDSEDRVAEYDRLKFSFKESKINFHPIDKNAFYYVMLLFALCNGNQEEAKIWVARLRTEAKDSPIYQAISGIVHLGFHYLTKKHVREGFVSTAIRSLQRDAPPEATKSFKPLFAFFRFLETPSNEWPNRPEPPEDSFTRLYFPLGEWLSTQKPFIEVYRDWWRNG